MSSCFLCDCSYSLTDNDRYSVVVSEGQSDYYFMKYMPIMVGSSGTDVDDQQHKNNNKQNYVSYRVKKIEFRASYEHSTSGDRLSVPCYVIIFKVPFREVVFDYYFGVMKNFMLYSEPESVLKYGVYSYPYIRSGSVFVTYRQKRSNDYDLIVDKPFIVGPNDYVGVLYFFGDPVRIDASARVWFDVV